MISKENRVLIITILILISILVPLFLSYLIAYENDKYQDREMDFRVGTYGNIEYWDPVLIDDYNVLSKYYSINCLESLFYIPEDSIDPEPSLALSWEFEYWLEENNSKGFINRGGVKALNITLREDVEFHDGSNWNATVAKWNIDRLYVITGNLTGNASNFDNRFMRNFWVDVDSVKPFFTANWNLSEYDSDGVTFTTDQYSGYFIDTNVTLYNPNPYGGWDPVLDGPIHYAPYDMYPIVRQVKIIENSQSGGKIRVEFNDWNSFEIKNLNFPMISMNTYKDYFDRGIYGFENDIKDPKNPTAVDHMIGTGPYIFQQHDKINERGYMLKNKNYWNKSALENGNWFDIERIEVVTFPEGEVEKYAMTFALLDHEIDYVIVDTQYDPLDFDTIKANPNINYIEYGVSDYITQITLNCINETWWSWGSPYNYRDNISSLFSDQGNPSGIPRSLRKAISYAFDYDLYISTLMKEPYRQSLKRAGGMLGEDNIYYNSSISLADYNLTKARKILLTTDEDPNTYTYTQDLYNFSNLCLTRNLTASSTDIEWQNITDTNPIYVLDFYWDNKHEVLKSIFQASLRNIGIALNVIGNISGIPSETSPWYSTFDGNHSIWSAQSWSWDNPMPSTLSESTITLYYNDLNSGSWRYDPWAPSTDTNFKWWPGWNFAFCYDEEVDNWITRLWFSNRSGKSKWFDKIVNKVQNELYPMIFVSQGMKALALWRKWEFNFNKGIMFFANLHYEIITCLCCKTTRYNPGIFLLLSVATVISIFPIKIIISKIANNFK